MIKKWGRNSKEYKDLIKKNIQFFKDSFSKEIKKIFVNSNLPTIIIPINFCYYYNLPLSKSAESCRNTANYSILANQWQSSVLEVNEFLLNQSANKNIFFLDIVKYFENTVRKENKYIDFVHLSKLGAKIYATKIKQLLKEENLL